jgi:hypothetical protein
MSGAVRHGPFRVQESRPIARVSLRLRPQVEFSRAAGSSASGPSPGSCSTTASRCCACRSRATVSALAILACAVLQLVTGCSARSASTNEVAGRCQPRSGSWVLLAANSRFAVATLPCGSSPITVCVSRAGPSEWEFKGIGWIASRSLPGGVVSLAANESDLRFRRLLVLSPDGSVTHEKRSGEGSFVPLSYEKRQACYADLGRSERSLVLVSPGGTQRIRIAGSSSVFDVHSSSDGSRLAVTSRSSGGWRLMWIRLSHRSGRVSTLRQRTAHPMAVVSGDGRHALLAGDGPEVVQFGKLRGRRIALRHASGGLVGRSRVLAIAMSTVNSQDTTEIIVSTIKGRTLWRTRLRGLVEVHCDPTVSRVGYVDPSTSRGIVVCLPSGFICDMGLDVADVYPIDKREAAVLMTDGRVVWKLVVGVSIDARRAVHRSLHRPAIAASACFLLQERFD